MNGIHDLGGMHGMGPINPPAEAPIFKYDWERTVFALFAPAAVAAGFNVDEFRHAIERMDPVHYLEGTYYEHWLASFETLMVEKGVLTQQELDARYEELKGAA